MSEGERPEPLEGWGVRSRPPLLLTAGVFGFLAVCIGVVAVFYRVLLPSAEAPRARPFPGPVLQTSQRRTAPSPGPAASSAVDRAMAQIAAKVVHAYDPLQATP